jgi:hypothetical protein
VEKYHLAEADGGEERNYREWIRLVLEVFTLVSAVVAVRFTYETLQETRRQVEAAMAEVRSAQVQADAAERQLDLSRRQFEAGVRPWIQIDNEPRKARRGLEFTAEGDLTFGIELKLLNVGNYVATAVTLHVTTIAHRERPSDDKEPIVVQKRICDGVQKATAGLTIFPGDKDVPLLVIDEKHTRIPRNQLAARAFLNEKSGQRDSVKPLIIGCVDYVGLDPAIHHQTRFIYELTVTGLGMHDNGPIVRIGRPLALSLLKFEPFKAGGFDAF